MKKGWLQRHFRRKLKKLPKMHRKKSNNWPMFSFIHNGSGIKTWMGYSFKAKNTKYRAAILSIYNHLF